ncbi:hypothetical protein LRAMOSA10500 [Lichtheimia ramosa]|uniref:Uncharacterized protein n=1 Tax=Lichtheimia ramosa TaxID=688394 RepID=A0A077WP26_9FUNG|nr:hypothetical protein LRAMOSA10500 [Lichtheimia ramosa]
MAHAPPHNSLRSVTANSSSSVFGLSLNKHGLSFQKPSSSPNNGRIAALPPLQLTVPVIGGGGEQESPSASRSFSSDTFKLQKQKQKETAHRPAMMSSTTTVDGYFQRTKQQRQRTISSIVDSSQSLVFAAGTLHTAVRRCLALCTGSNNSVDLDSISDALGKSSISVEELVQALDDNDSRHVGKYASECIRHLQALCVSIQQQVPSLVPCLDPRFARHLLLTIHGTTVDIKEACETLQSTIQKPSQQQHLLSPDNAFKQQHSPHPPPYLRTRSHSEYATASTASSPLDDHDRSQLHTHLKLAVTHSLHVTDLLKKSIDETVAKDDCAPTLRQKLLNLGQQAQQAAGMATRLDQGLQRIMTKDTTSSSPSSIEGNKAFWEETNEYLKVIISVMRGMQSISTQEDFGWPKAVKQGCLQVTRVTAEVAKVWNRYSASFTSAEAESSTSTISGKQDENKTYSSSSSYSDQ